MFVKIFVKLKKTQVLYSLRSLDIQCLRCVCVYSGQHQQQRGGREERGRQAICGSGGH